MKKRLLSVLLCLCMVWAMLPTTALAANTPTVCVGGVAMYTDSSTITYYKNGDTSSTGLTGTENDWNAMYEPSSNTLTIKNLSVRGTGNTQATAVGIYSNVTGLILQVEGANSVTGSDGSYGYGIYIDTGGTLTIRGSGSLSVTAYYLYAGIESKGNLTIEDNVTLSASGEFGILVEGNLTVSDQAVVIVPEGWDAYSETTISVDLELDKNYYVVSTDATALTMENSPEITTTKESTNYTLLAVSLYSGDASTCGISGSFIATGISGAVEVNSGDVTAMGGSTNSNSSGVHTNSGSISVSGGTLNASGGTGSYGYFDGDTQLFPESGLTEIADLFAGTYEVRAADNSSGTNASTVTEVTVPAYTPSTPTVSITVPVSGEENTVHVDAKVTGESASVEPVDEDEVYHIAQGDTDTPITIDFSVLKNDITEVKIPTQSVELISEAANNEDTAITGLKVDLTYASVEFDAPALAAIVEKMKDAGGTAQSADDITLIVDERAAGTLTNAQQETVKEMPNALILEATVLVNGVPVHDFKGGSVTVTFPYELTDTQSAEYITVWHIADDGKKEAMRTEYNAEEKKVCFIAPHLSHYVVTGDEANYAHVCPSEPYTDVDQSLWYHEVVDYVIENGLMVGTGENIFEPNTDTSRAMIVTILWRLENEPICGQGKSGTFSDVPEYQWYTEAVEWAAANGIVNGYTGGYERFGPEDPVTREQLAAILWRYAKYKGYDVSVGENTDILSFEDALAVSEYAVSAMQWSVGAGIIEGVPGENDNMLLDPQGSGIRVQSAAIIMRFCEKVMK